MCVPSTNSCSRATQGYILELSPNRILSSLSAQDRSELAPFLLPVDLPLRKKLQPRGVKIPFVYFLESGLASVVAMGRGERRQSEAGLIGFDGMTGIAITHATDRSPSEIFMQVAGHGQQIDADQLRSLIEGSATLARLLLHYAHAFGIQVEHTALANAKGKIEERLARWLLMVHDRTEGDHLKLTHEFIGLMLGTQRSGVTLAIGNLEDRRLLNCSRGDIEVIDRVGLTALANGLYGVPEAEFSRLFH
jgi:CRP-like cAMP-binding protein